MLLSYYIQIALVQPLNDQLLREIIFWGQLDLNVYKLDLNVYKHVQSTYTESVVSIFISTKLYVTC